MSQESEPTFVGSYELLRPGADAAGQEAGGICQVCKAAASVVGLDVEHTLPSHSFVIGRHWRLCEDCLSAVRNTGVNGLRLRAATTFLDAGWSDWVLAAIASAVAGRGTDGLEDPRS